MSVTFSPVINETPVHSLSCAVCGGQASGTWFQVYDLADKHYYECGTTPEITETYSDPNMGVQINLSNRNAKEVLDLLGLPSTEEEGLYGTLSADDMLGRVLIAQGVNQRSGFLPAVVEGNLYDGGRDENYFERVLAEIAEVVQAAKSLGADVSYG